MISISTHSRADYIEIVIGDNGSGIPEALINKVFDPFFTTKAVGKGSGQGLAIAYSVIVDKHAGKISVDSKPGVGTAFTMQLPRVDKIKEA